MVILFIICLFILFIGFYFHNKKWDPKRAHFYPRGETIKIGHRGAPTLARENTLESFEIAFQAGFKGIELDVQFSKDDKLVVFHDWCIKNINGKYENIHAMAYSDILLISQRENFHIPLLNEVLEILPEERFINIEIKSPFYLNLSLVKKVVNAIQQYNIQKYAESFGYGVVKSLVGHGIGRKLHEEPQVPNFGFENTGHPIEEGMCLAIEPMINMGSSEIYQKADGWTECTVDNKPSAHFEHSLAFFDGKVKVLTK